MKGTGPIRKVNKYEEVKSISGLTFLKNTCANFDLFGFLSRDVPSESPLR